MVLPPLLAGLRTRIAPTPSGLLHPGNGASFLLAYGLAREAGGDLLLRIDDLDAGRARPAYIEDIFETLHWLGIRWDRGPRDAADHQAHWSQELRLHRYRALLEELRQRNALYACTCSRRMVEECSCAEKDLPLDAPDRTWRLRVPKPCNVRFRTWPEGGRTIDLALVMPDPVLRQRNGRPAYQIASLADDVDFGIDFIVRGEDLLPSTACQIHLAALLGLKEFANVQFVHHPLVQDARGHKLSKSQGAGSLRALREAGVGPEVIEEGARDLLQRTLASVDARGRSRRW